MRIWIAAAGLGTLGAGMALAHAAEQGFVLLLPTDVYIGAGVASVALTVVLLALLPPEAIAWHLLEVLNPKMDVYRMVFHEITPAAIQEAIDHPRDLSYWLGRDALTHLFIEGRSVSLTAA